MEMLFTETLDKHFYTNDRENYVKKGNTEAISSDVIIPEDAINYIIKKYNFNIN